MMFTDGLKVKFFLISRPGQSQGRLYKQPCDSFINSLGQWPFPPTALRGRHAQMVRDMSSSYKIGYVIVIKKFLSPEGHQNPISGSKVTAGGWIDARCTDAVMHGVLMQ